MTVYHHLYLLLYQHYRARVRSVYRVPEHPRARRRRHLSPRIFVKQKTENSLRPKRPVPRVAQARHDVPVVVEFLVDHRGV
jgi:hypothetical protein